MKENKPSRTKHSDLMTQWMLDPKFKQEFNNLEEEYDLVRQMLQARKKSGLSQNEVANLMGTKLPIVARLESTSVQSKRSPSINTLRKYAKAVGCKLSVRFTPDNNTKKDSSL